ncbi:MAG: DUF6152 family protein [Gammaproteobacteria bacterium]|nr:DUF6152 family protein [Gammaproteobacteria bacterium]
MKTILLATASTLLLIAGSVAAHHSGSMFDRSQVVTLQGTIKEYQFENPHVWFEIIVTDAEGNETQWSVEGEGRSRMTSMGLGRSVVVPGLEVTIRAHPLRDGRNGGSFIDIKMPDGAVIDSSMGGFGGFNPGTG